MEKLEKAEEKQAPKLKSALKKGGTKKKVQIVVESAQDQTLPILSNAQGNNQESSELSGNGSNSGMREQPVQLPTLKQSAPRTKSKGMSSLQNIQDRIKLAIEKNSSKKVLEGEFSEIQDLQKKDVEQVDIKKYQDKDNLGSSFNSKVPFPIKKDQLSFVEKVQSTKQNNANHLLLPAINKPLYSEPQKELLPSPKNSQQISTTLLKPPSQQGQRYLLAKKGSESNMPLIQKEYFAKSEKHELLVSPTPTVLISSFEKNQERSRAQSLSNSNPFIVASNIDDSQVIQKQKKHLSIAEKLQSIKGRLQFGSQSPLNQEYKQQCASLLMLPIQRPASKSRRNEWNEKEEMNTVETAVKKKKTLNFLETFKEQNNPLNDSSDGNETIDLILHNQKKSLVKTMGRYNSEKQIPPRTLKTQKKMSPLDFENQLARLGEELY